MPPGDLSRPSGGGTPPGAGSLDRSRCQVGGINQNYTSRAGTPYHIQIEDRGPVVDRVSEQEVRRLSLIVYANYGEPNARIVHGADHDFPDLRTHEHNRFIEQKIQELAAQARQVIEEKEDRQVARIKALLHEYYATKDEATKKEFEEANVAFPFVFSRAWMEMKADKSSAAAAPPSADVAAADEIVYPLDDDLRERVIEIERLIFALGQDLSRLKQQGGADDILLQTCRKLVARAQESLSGREPAEFSARRLDMTRGSLMTTWRQVKSRLK
ncbi:MAG TPA: hypothetical protein VGN09_03160 [Vicinamibacteria bacterium]